MGPLYMVTGLGPAIDEIAWSVREPVQERLGCLPPAWAGSVRVCNH